MKTIQKELQNSKVLYPLENIADPAQIVFLDIETTGFSAKLSKVYLIGCIYQADGNWQLIQWLTEKEGEEASLLSAFFQFLQSHPLLLHFNGSTFDLPFLTYKCQEFGLPYSFQGFDDLDLYKRIAPLRHFLRLPNCKQRTLEQFLGVRREDPYSGGELIDLYKQYENHPTETAEKTLLLHNEEDMKGMLAILPMLTYYDLFLERVIVKKAQANYYLDLNGVRRQELLMTLALPVLLPKPISTSAKGCYFSAEGERGSLKVPIYEEELKYFYSNYKDYYYLPMEDMALHKSVANFVDKEHRIQATASTCYTRKQSLYLPQWDDLIKPFFKRDYKDKELYFELTDEFKHDRQAFNDYANHVLEMIVTNV